MTTTSEVKYFNWVRAPFWRKLVFLFFTKHSISYSPVKNLIITMRVCVLGQSVYLYDTVIYYFATEDPILLVQPRDGSEGGNA